MFETSLFLLYLFIVPCAECAVEFVDAPDVVFSIRMICPEEPQMHCES